MEDVKRSQKVLTQNNCFTDLFLRLYLTIVLVQESFKRSHFDCTPCGCYGNENGNENVYLRMINCLFKKNNYLRMIVFDSLKRYLCTLTRFDLFLWMNI